VKAGRILRHITTKNGKEVILRTPRSEDLDDLLEHINSLVDEGAEIARNDKTTREEEADWLERKLSTLEKGEERFIVAELDGKVIATSNLTRRSGYSSHVGVIGIAITKGYRNIGIGTKMLETLSSEAKKVGLKMLSLQLFSTNEAAYHVYTKLGFKETGRIPKIFYKDGNYIDEVIMTKEI